MVHTLLFGVSTLTLRGLSIERAIYEVAQAGFLAFEFVPYVWKPPAAFSAKEREELARWLTVFPYVTIHSSSANGANLHSDDATKREQSWQEYVALLQLAADISARVVSFHQVTPKFAEYAATFGEQHGPSIGIETFEQAMLDAFGWKNLGSLFDVGHAALRIGEKLHPAIIHWMDERRGGIVQFHFHGVIKREGKLEDHHPIDAANIMDYKAICQRLSEWDYPGPLIFEIGIRNEAWKRNLRWCKEAKSLLTADASGN